MMQKLKKHLKKCLILSIMLSLANLYSNFKLQMMDATHLSYQAQIKRQLDNSYIASFNQSVIMKDHGVANITHLITAAHHERITDQTRTPDVDTGRLHFLNKYEIDTKQRSNRTLSKSYSHLFPDNKKLEVHDRIIGQLLALVPNSSASKVIYVMDGKKEAKDANTRLHEEHCGVTSCLFTHDRNHVASADAILFSGMTPMFMQRSNANQIWISRSLEAPPTVHHHYTRAASSLVNWTATYRRDSTLVTPYEKFVPFSKHRQNHTQQRDYMGTKNRMAAWFVSNCNSNNGRLLYAKELQKYIQVDIYGWCGTKRCPRMESDTKCFHLLKNTYKFYLAFENSNCKDYITEKLYWNAYRNDIIPVVMGAHPDDYAAVAPPHSYIHVDDFESPQHLAEHLLQVSQDRALYNSYFAWRGTGEFINTRFWCRLCAMVHAVDAGSLNTWYRDVHAWWEESGVCVAPLRHPWATWRGVNMTLTRVPQRTDVP